MQRSVNAHVGQRVRQRRWEVGMTLQKLSDRVGITAQQIMKIEAGTNEISASQMRDIATALEVPASLFSEGFARTFNSMARSGHPIPASSDPTGWATGFTPHPRALTRHRRCLQHQRRVQFGNAVNQV